MPSLKHLGGETFRIAVSGPFARAHRPGRICRLWWWALRSVSKVLLVAATALVLLVGWTVTEGDPFRKMSPAGWASVALAGALLAAALCRSRPVRILPFKNLAGADGTGPAAVVAEGFAELLDSEIRRIVDLVRQEPFMTPADVLNPAGRRGDVVRRSPARVPFQTGVAAAGLPGDIKPTEVGTVTLGPLRLQVGTVVTWLERLFGTTLQGSLVDADGVLRGIASQSGLRGGRSWSAQVRIDGEVRRSDARLARELAHRIELERPGARESGADLESFQRLVDGLESYRRFQQEGLLQYLDEAEDHFRSALAHSREYAAAYHNLGVVYLEQRRVRAEIGFAVSEAVGRAPVQMWQKAVALDPTLAPARVQLARAFVEQADRPDVGAGKRADLLEQAVQAARSALEQPSGTHPMDDSLASYWIGDALLKQGGHHHPQHTKSRRSNRRVRQALRCFRRTEQDLIDERARRLVRDGDPTAVRPLTERIATVVGRESECWSTLAGRARGPIRWHRLNKARRRNSTAIRWAPDLPKLHLQRGRILVQSGHRDRAWLALLEALQRDPQNHHVTAKDVGNLVAHTQTGRQAPKMAMDLYVLAAHQHPDDAVVWLLLARLAAADDRAARSLAGKALALGAGTEHVRCIVDQLWPPDDATTPDAPNWEERFTLRWARAWDQARHARQTSDEPRLRAALRSIEELRGERGGTRPEVSFTARETGLLYTSLALMVPPSDEQRAHWMSAVRYFTDAVESESPAQLEKPPLWYVELADAHAALGDSQSDAGRRAEAMDNYRLSLAYYDSVINRSPKTVCPRYRTGHVGQERLTELSAEPSDLPPRARALAGRAAVHARQGCIGDAVRDCRDALKLAPLYAYPRFTLARLYRDQRAQYDLAEQTLLRLVELLPTGEQRDIARLELARTYRAEAATAVDGTGDRLLDRARNELVKATRDASLGADVEARMHQELATVLDLLGRSDEAVRALRAIVGTRRQPDAFRIHERIADLMAGSEPLREVEQELLKAQQACSARLDTCRGTDEERMLRTALVTLTARLAMFYAEHGIKLDEAHLMADGALRSALSILDPSGLATCEDVRGWIAYREGDFPEAVTLLEKAVEHSGGDAREWAHLACALEARARARTRRPWHRPRDIDRARDIWRDVLEHFPSTPAAAQAGHHLDLLEPPLARAARLLRPAGSPHTQVLNESRPGRYGPSHGGESPAKDDNRHFTRQEERS
ncbi:hypothetical protein [Streptomyces sp. NPDC004546]|uniref:tetratricopeptide repeat protein n=1 Tax=Streptomyces sp. NPDC004546 TaxID=3154282 RepID=UPI0033A37260